MFEDGQYQNPPTELTIQLFTKFIIHGCHVLAICEAVNDQEDVSFGELLQRGMEMAGVSIERCLGNRDPHTPMDLKDLVYMTEGFIREAHQRLKIDP